MLNEIWGIWEFELGWVLVLVSRSRRSAFPIFCDVRRTHSLLTVLVPQYALYCTFRSVIWRASMRITRMEDGE